jgi:hypothetical protein
MNANWQQWTLRHIRGLVEKLEHLESSVDDMLNSDAHHQQLERMRTFAPRTDLTTVDALIDALPDPAPLPSLVLQRLAPFFDGALLLEFNPRLDLWQLAAFVTRGEYFHLEEKEQLEASHLIQPLGPDQVLKANAEAMLAEIPLPFALSSSSAQAFLILPTPTAAYILISDVPPLWSEDHMRSALRLINQAFNP